MEDIALTLIEEINKSYNNNISKRRMEVLYKKIKDGSATYIDAHNLAKEVGNARAKAFKACINSNVLPDGKMYFNIADRVLRDSLEHDYQTIVSACEEIQKSINSRAKIGLKAQIPEFNEDGVQGIINRISSENVFDDVAWILDEPIKVYELKNVDRAIEKNAKFQNDAGIKATVTRHADSKCCEWCDSLAGEYTYPGVPGDVFARHDNCRCSLDYNATKLKAYTSKSGYTNTFR